MGPYTVLIVSLAAFVLVFGGLILSANHDERKKANYEKWLESNNHRLVRRFKCIGAFVGISKDALFVDESFYPFASMAGCTLLSKNQTSTSGGAGGAIAGGLIGGPVGAVVGSSVSSRTTVSVDSAYGVRVRFRAPSVPSLSVTSMPPKSAVALFEALTTAIENVEKQELQKMIATSKAPHPSLPGAGDPSGAEGNADLPAPSSRSEENGQTDPASGAMPARPASSAARSGHAERAWAIWRYCQSGWQYYDNREGRDTGDEFTETIFQHAARRFRMPVEAVWAAYERCQAEMENPSAPATEATETPENVQTHDAKAEQESSAPNGKAAREDAPDGKKKEKTLSPWLLLVLFLCLIAPVVVIGIIEYDSSTRSSKKLAAQTQPTETLAATATASPTDTPEPVDERETNDSFVSSSVKKEYPLEDVLDAVGAWQVNALSKSFDASFWAKDGSLFVSVYLPIQKSDVRLLLLTDVGKSQFDEIYASMAEISTAAWDQIVSYGYKYEAVYSFDVLDEDGRTLLCFYNDECSYDVSKDMAA